MADALIFRIVMLKCGEQSVWHQIDGMSCFEDHARVFGAVYTAVGGIVLPDDRVLDGYKHQLEEIAVRSLCQITDLLDHVRGQMPVLLIFFSLPGILHKAVEDAFAKRTLMRNLVQVTKSPICSSIVARSPGSIPALDAYQLLLQSTSVLMSDN